MTLSMPTTANAHMTFKANMGVGRHGWLRLTPAYSVGLVRERIASEPEGSVIFDPFSGTGTSPLAAAELGHIGLSVDVNPFLIWLGNTKLRNYSVDELSTARALLAELLAFASKNVGKDFWQPNLFKIEKWWNLSNLNALKAIRAGIDELVPNGPISDLFDIAFCRVLIQVSSASFSHQSMSFKDVVHDHSQWSEDEALVVFAEFEDSALTIFESAELDLLGNGEVFIGDSRDLSTLPTLKADYVVTSPPYVNRMSYIRELRPYMYWLRYLDQAADAGELDWKAIGGTWGTATSKLNSWRPSETGTPVDSTMDAVRAKIAAEGGKNGPLLSNYVGKYFHDMWEHFNTISNVIQPNGKLSYIVGNSTFYGNVVPAEEWYALMLKELGFEDVNVEVIRKRNSNKHLYEFDVTARKASH